MQLLASGDPRWRGIIRYYSILAILSTVFSIVVLTSSSIIAKEIWDASFRRLQGDEARPHPAHLIFFESFVPFMTTIATIILLYLYCCALKTTISSMIYRITFLMFVAYLIMFPLWSVCDFKVLSAAPEFCFVWPSPMRERHRFSSAQWVRFSFGLAQSFVLFTMVVFTHMAWRRERKGTPMSAGSHRTQYDIALKSDDEGGPSAIRN